MRGGAWKSEIIPDVMPVCVDQPINRNSVLPGFLAHKGRGGGAFNVAMQFCFQDHYANPLTGISDARLSQLSSAQSALRSNI